MKRPKIICGWGSAPDPIEGAYDAVPDPVVGWRGGHLPLLSHHHLTAVYSWTFFGKGRKDGHP